MQLMVRLTNWGGFAGGRLAVAAVQEKEAEASLAMAQARAAVAAKGEKSVAAQKAAASADPEVQRANTEYIEAYAMRRAMESVYNAFDAKAKVVSRDLTRRTGFREMENRTGKWGT